MKALRGPRLYAYGALAAPLAMLSLPVYVHIPKFYAEQFGLALGNQGALLLAARACDGIQDPALGYLSDYAQARGIDRRAWIIAGAPLLAAASYGLFAPPAAVLPHIAWWFFAMLVLVYGALALMQISYHAYGAELSTDATQRTRITAIREACGLVGVLAGAILPQVCATAWGPRAGYAAFALGVAALLLIATGVSARCGPAPLARPAVYRGGEAWWRTMTRPLANPALRHLLTVFMLNGTANAIPATLVLFYVGDVIGRDDLGAAFLCVYFAAGVVAMPLWPWLARRAGTTRAWLLGMLASMVAFIWAVFLGPGDVLPFFLICGWSGLALGADLALPPALLADTIDHEVADGRGYPSGAYFGLWALITKLNLALAAGITLPLLAVFGYTANNTPTSHAVLALTLSYGLLPCLLKAGACIVLMRARPTPPPMHLVTA